MFVHCAGGKIFNLNSSKQIKQIRLFCEILLCISAFYISISNGIEIHIVILVVLWLWWILFAASPSSARRGSSIPQMTSDHHQRPTTRSQGMKGHPIIFEFELLCLSTSFGLHWVRVSSVCFCIIDISV
jgi:hypothetical protein